MCVFQSEYIANSEFVINVNLSLVINEIHKWRHDTEQITTNIMTRIDTLEETYPKAHI